MKISYKCEYVLRVMADLSQKYPEALSHIEEIAKRQQIPKKYLGQILLSLKKRGFLESKKGPQGGYTLSRHPKEISLGEVIRFVEGLASSSNLSYSAPGEQSPAVKNIFAEIWQEVDDAVSGILDKISFEDIRVTISEPKETINYCI
ncbi:MAG: Rrf2 family transcriptional regulator [Syntrophales bacterium]|nr:Rrf2 family transcriptional regulator [Syntrophales bacterium]